MSAQSSQHDKPGTATSPKPEQDVDRAPFQTYSTTESESYESKHKKLAKK